MVLTLFLNLVYLQVCFFSPPPLIKKAVLELVRIKVQIWDLDKSMSLDINDNDVQEQLDEHYKVKYKEHINTNCTIFYSHQIKNLCNLYLKIC